MQMGVRVNRNMEVQMGLRFYIGASGAGKSYQLYDHIIRESMANPHVNYLIVVPDQFTMQTQLEIGRAHV